MNDELSDEKREEAVVERLLATIGRYALAFQSLESIVEECLHLLWGHDHFEENHVRLARMTNQQKVDALLQEFRENPMNARGRSRPEWVARFEGLIARLHAERQKRNSILHSQYLYDFVRIGHPVMQIDRRGANTDWTDERQDDLLRTLAVLVFDTGQARIQLVHDYGAVHRGLWRTPESNG